jgi:heptosyltransferase-2
MVMAQALFIVLKRRYPDCDIDVVSPQWSLPILERMPEVRNGVALRVAHGELELKTRYRLGRSLRSRNYTHAIVLPRSWKSALLPYVAAVPVRTGYKGEMRYVLLNDMRKLNTSVLTKTVQRYVALAYDESEVSATAPAVPYPQLILDKDNLDRLIQALGLNLDRPVVGFMPGAEYGPAKQWPVECFAQLALVLVERGFQVWVFGSTKEEQLGERIAQGLEQVYNLCGKTEIIDVIDLIAAAHEVVTNDSGLMHIAAAMDVRVNVIYGSSTPAYTPPLSNRATIFYKMLDCSPCFDRQCRFRHYNCLKQITPDEVAEKIVTE